MLGSLTELCEIIVGARAPVPAQRALAAFVADWAPCPISAEAVASELDQAQVAV